MANGRALLRWTCLWACLWIGTPGFPLCAALGQSAQAVIQQAVNAERAANQNDHSNWIYLENSSKPKEHLVRWVAATQQGDVERVIERDGRPVPDAQQRETIQGFLHDARAQKKQVSENMHDNQQVDAFLKLLPEAFVWTETSSTATETVLHYEPAPGFHPPTREAKVFSEMSGEMVVDHQQHRIRSMSGRLGREVTFGGGLLGRLKEGSSFSLEQAQVGEGQWQLTATHVRLEGNALLFKSISLQQDEVRSRFVAQPAGMTLEQAAVVVMSQQ
jgi:hypothetical protein